MSTLPSVAEVRRSIPSANAARSVSSDGAGASTATSQENAGGTALPAVSSGAGRSPMRRRAQPTALRIATIHDNRLSQPSTSSDGTGTRLHHVTNAGNGTAAAGVSIIMDKLLLEDNFAKSSGTTSAGLSPQQSLVGEVLSPDTRTRPLGTPSPGTARPRRSLPNMVPNNSAGASVRPAGLHRSFSPNAADPRRPAATQPHAISTSSRSPVYDTGRASPHYQMSPSEWPASPSASSQMQPRPPVQPGEEPLLASGGIQSLHVATLHTPPVAQMSPRVIRMQLVQAPSFSPSSAPQSAISQQLATEAEEPAEVPPPPSPGAVPLDAKNTAPPPPPPPPAPQAPNHTAHPAAAASGIPPLPPQHQQHQHQPQVHLSRPSDNGGGTGSSGTGVLVAASPGDSRLLADLAAAVVDLQRRVAEMTPRQGRDSYASDAGSGSSWWSRSNRSSVPGTITCDPSSLSILFSTNTSTSGAAPGPLGGGSATASTSTLPTCLAPSPADRLTAERLTAVELKLSQLAASTATAGMKPPPSPFWSESGEPQPQPQAPLPPLAGAPGHDASVPGCGRGPAPGATAAMGFALGLAVAAVAASAGAVGGQQGSPGARRAPLGRQPLGLVAGAGAGVAEAARRLDALEQRLDAVLHRVADTERRVSEQVSAGGAQARQLEQLGQEARAVADAARLGAEERHQLDNRLGALEERVVGGDGGGGGGDGDEGGQVSLASRVSALEGKARGEGLEERLQALEKRVVRTQEQQLALPVPSQPQPSPPLPPQQHQQGDNAAQKARAAEEVCATTLADRRTEDLGRRLVAVEKVLAGLREDVRHPSPAAPPPPPPRDATSASIDISGAAAAATAVSCINNAGPAAVVTAAAVEELQRGLQAVTHRVQDVVLQVASVRAQSSSCASEIQAVLEQIHAVRTTATAAAASARQASTAAAAAERLAEAALDAVDTASVAARATGGGRGRLPYDTGISAAAAAGLTVVPSRWEVWLPPEQARKSLEEEMLDAISSGDGNLQSQASLPAPLAAEDSSTTVASRQRRLSVGRDVGFHIRPDGADVATGGGVSLYGVSPTRGNILDLTVARLDELEAALDELRSKLGKGLALRVTRDELRESVSSVELQLRSTLEGLISNHNEGNGNGSGGMGHGNEHATPAPAGTRGAASARGVGSLHARGAIATGAGSSTEEVAGKGSSGGGGSGGVSWAPGTGGQADGGGGGGSRGGSRSGLAAAAGVARPPKAPDAQRVLSLCHGIASLGGGGGGGGGGAGGGGPALEDVGSGSIAARGRASFAWRAHTAGAVAALQRAVEVLEQRMEVAEAGLLHQTGVDERVTALSDSVQLLQASTSFSSHGRTASAVHSRSTSVKTRDNPILRGLDEQLVLLVHRVDASEELQGALDKEVRELATRVRALGSAVEKEPPSRPGCD